MAAWRPVMLVLIFVAGIVLLVSGCRDGNGGGANPSRPATETVTIKGQTFELEIAADTAAIQRGLMHRETIAEGTGMLFIFPDARQRGFWMKNCLTDIDIIYLDPNGRVTATHHMKAEPPKRRDETEFEYEQRLKTYSSRWPAQFAIELPPGTLDQLNVRFEDKIDLDLDRLKALAR